MRRLIDDERGAMAVVVAVMMVALLAVGAIVIDIGALYQERRELQNGADAAALAIAKDCSGGACAAFTTTADSYADANADDGSSNVDEVCGTGAGMAACTDPPTVPDGAGYVRVSTSTRDASDGSTQISFGLARVLGLTGSTVHARAVVAWGSPAGITSSLPLTISECEWSSYTSDGTTYAPPPPYPPWPTSPAERTIYFHDTTGASPCPAGPSGADLSGGFGWLETSSDCYATSTSGNWFDDSTGRPPPNSCDPPEMRALVGTVVFVPVFDQTNGLTGSNGSYHILSYAAFYLTGYSIEGQFKERSLVTGDYPCSGQASCISGFFTTGVAPSSATIGATSDLGVVVIKMFE